MAVQTSGAGPGPTPQPWDGREAAGPVCSRLLIEEVSFSLKPHGLSAQVTLALGPHRFAGNEAGRGEQIWQLAAAAAVKAVQHYLQQCDTAPPLPQVRLLAAATTATTFGQEIVHVTVNFRHGDRSDCLLGSALVRNDRCRTAVAAALDALSRQVGAYHLAAVEVAPAPSQLSAAPPRVAPPALARRPPAVRPAQAVAQHRPLVLGLAASHAGVCAVAVDADGEVVTQVRRAGDPSRPEAAVATVVETALEAVSQVNSHASLLGAVGIAAPGAVQPAEGLCTASRVFPLWQDVQLAAPLADALSLPVEVVSAVPAAALAEVEFGAARGLSDVLYLRVESDIEAALVARGVPVSTIGDLSHLMVDPKGPRCECGAAGCWKMIAGTETLITRVSEAVESGAKSPLGSARRTPKLTPEVVCWAAAAGDPVAKGAVEATGRCLADGIGNLVTMFNPEAVILESESSTVGAALRRAVEASLKTSARAAAFSRCVLLPPELGEAAPALGAAAWAARKLRNL